MKFTETLFAAEKEFKEEPMSDFYFNFFLGFPSRLRVSILLQKLNIFKNDIILDAGCESGYVSLKLSKKCKKVISVDIVTDAIKDLNKKIKQSKIKNIKTLVCPLHKLKFKKNIINKIVFTEVIEHCFNPKKVFDNFYKILKKDGLLIITFPNEFLRRLLYPFINLLGIKTSIEKDVTLFSYNYEDIEKFLGKKFIIIEKFNLFSFFPITRFVICRKK
jgi:ubiquinone/menaquinone biosynthesis C-methylase UbiE